MSKRDLLQKLSTIRHAERGIVPDAAWVERKRAHLVKQVRNDLASGVVFRAPRVHNEPPVFVSRFMQLMRAPALITASIITTVFGGSLLGVSASERSVPGDFLYPIKIASEQTQLALTPDKADKLRLKTEFVGRRVDEIKTIVAAPDASSPDRLRQAAQGLKRDLDTVKTQLQEVKQDTPGQTAVDVAKLVDQKSDDVAQQLKQVKDTVPQEVKPSVTEAEVAAVHTGVAAVEVLIDTKSSTSSQDIISDADVASAIQNKVDGIQATLDGAAGRLLSPTASSTAASTSTLSLAAASSSALQITTASATLQEVRNLVGENKLGDVTDKLYEAARTALQVESDVDLANASTSTPSTSPSSATTSTQPLPGTSTSTPNMSTSTPATTSTVSTPTSSSTKATSTVKTTTPP